MIPSGPGRIAVDVAGTGPLVLCVPGMGDLRSSYRHLAPGLVAAGYRVATMDLRGHGDSTLGFADHGDEATAADVLAVVTALDAIGGGATGGDGHRSGAVVIGTSMGAAAAVLAAAREPDRVRAVVLIGPFVRDHGPGWKRLALRVALLPPWGPAVWRRFYASLFPSGGPADHAEHLARVAAALTRPGRWAAFRRTASASHAAAEAALPGVAAPALVVMGDRDPDFPDPEAEARWVAERVGGEHRMIAGSGHYPMADRAAQTLAAVLAFLDREATRG